MKKATAITFCLLIAAGSLFFGCKKEKTADGDNSLKYIMGRNKFIMGLEDNFPPMGFRNEKNEIIGYDVDIAREAVRRMGVEFVIQPIDWATKERELYGMHIDCIWNGYSITEERREHILFSPPYLLNNLVVVTKNDSSIYNISDLTGKAIGAQANTISEGVIESNDDFKRAFRNIVYYKDFPSAMMDVEVGGTDAALGDEVVIRYHINNSRMSLRIIDEIIESDVYGIGFRLGEHALADKLWEVLLEMAKDGTVEEITKRWFGEDISLIGK